MSGAAESMFEIGANACAVARAERVAFIVDANGYFGAFVEARNAPSARSSCSRGTSTARFTCSIVYLGALAQLAAKPRK
jgi:hypothetical protein